MKIIGFQDKSYIAVITHEELEKVFDKYYGKLNRLQVGDDINLGEGYNFRSDIKTACQNMVAATTAFNTAQASMLRFATMVTEIEDNEN